jgi:hypothetical protein
MTFKHDSPHAGFFGLPRHLQSIGPPFDSGVRTVMQVHIYGTSHDRIDVAHFYFTST